MINRLLCLTVLLVLSTASAAPAIPLAVRVEAGATDYSRRSFSSYSLGYSELALDGGHMLSVAGEYRTSTLLGVEVSLSEVALEARWREVAIRGEGNPPRPVEVPVGADSGTFSARPIGATLLFHFQPWEKSDLYLGPQVAWVIYDIGLQGPPQRDGELALGAKLGWEWQLAGSRWSTGLTYRFLDVQHQGTERDQYTGLGLHLISLALSRRWAEP